MANGNQMEHLIRESTDRVAEAGRNADFVDLHLASIGYLAHEINKPQWWSVKRLLPVAFGAGAAFGSGILAGIFRVIGVSQ